MGFLYWLSAAQIILENFPVSSSGHVILLFSLLNNVGYFQNAVILSKQFSLISLQVWDFFLHGFTTIVVGLFFLPRWLFLLKNYRRTLFYIVKLIMYTVFADLITVLFFVVKMVIPFSPPLFVGFFVTALLLFSLRWCIKQTKNSLTLKNALILGMAQGVALLPGISRFATVFVVGRWLGFSNIQAFEITWMIQWPIICIASLYGTYCVLTQAPEMVSNGYMQITLLSSSIIAFFALYFVSYLVRTNKLWIFSVYMLIPIFLSFCL